MDRSEQEQLVRVGPGTPAGTLFRRYWQPALLASELAEPDGAPVRVRLLGEDLIAFRDTSGRVGLVDAYCPHRRAPLFFGRNEECGLRCVYHGWKFDAGGACVELPTEPASSSMKNHIRIKAYPTAERGGLVWAYMGPADAMPPAPDYEWLRAPETHRAVSKSYQSSNYLQGLEGGLDTAHVTYLHNNKIGDRANLFGRDGAPRIDVHETDYGYFYVSRRRLDEAREFVRVYQYILPFQQMRPNVTPSGLATSIGIPRYDGHIWVPIDDTQTHVYNWMCGYDADAALPHDYVERAEAGYGRGRDDFVPGTFRLKANLDNDFLIDRAAQKSRSFTGIKGINTQDMAIQEGMGPIVDRTREHPGSSDKAILAMRQILSGAIRAVAHGETPRGLDPSSHRTVRPHDGFVPTGADWRSAFAADFHARW